MKKIISLLLVLAVISVSTATADINAPRPHFSVDSKNQSIDSKNQSIDSKNHSIDISNLSYDELVALKERINFAIWNSKEWREVRVPQGDWIVGESIPAGKWTIKCADGEKNSTFMKCCVIDWGYYKPEGGISTSNGGGTATIYHPDNIHYESGQMTELTVDLKENMIVRIVGFFAPAIFTPYAGNPDLVFEPASVSTSEPTEKPTQKPTAVPTSEPTEKPTQKPTVKDSNAKNLSKDEYNKYAAIFIGIVKMTLKKPDSLEVHWVKVMEYNEDLYIVFSFSAMNGFGGYTRDTWSFKFDAGYISLTGDSSDYELYEKHKGEFKEFCSLDLDEVMKRVK